MINALRLVLEVHYYYAKTFIMEHKELPYKKRHQHHLIKKNTINSQTLRRVDISFFFIIRQFSNYHNNKHHIGTVGCYKKNYKKLLQLKSFL